MERSWAATSLGNMRLRVPRNDIQSNKLEGMVRRQHKQCNNPLAGGGEGNGEQEQVGQEEVSSGGAEGGSQFQNISLHSITGSQSIRGATAAGNTYKTGAAPPSATAAPTAEAEAGIGRSKSKVRIGVSRAIIPATGNAYKTTFVEVRLRFQHLCVE